MQSIFEYDDFRTFLAAWFRDRNGRPSMRGFAKRVTCSAALVSSVVSGDRRLDEDWIEPFTKALRFNTDQEADYFRLLALAGGARSDEVRLDARQRADAMQSFYRARKRRLDAYAVMARGIGPVLLELARTGIDLTDPKGVAAKLRGRYTTDEIEAALAALIDAEILVVCEDGKMLSAVENLATDHQESEPAQRETLKSFHRWALNTASEGIGLPAEQRHFGATVIALPTNRMAEVVALLNDLHERIISLSQQGPCEGGEVFLVSTQLVTLSEGVAPGRQTR